MTTFRQVVRAACARHDNVKPEPDDLARLIAEELKAAGYSIHRSGECVHPRTRRQDLGREMTPDEEMMLNG